MPGFLSSIFDGSSPSESQDDLSDHQDSSSYEENAEEEAHADPSISIGNSMSGSYENPDGSTHSWERSDEVTLTTDTHIVAAVDTIVTIDDQSY